MGVLRLCTGERAKVPYCFEPTGTNLYTLEELIWHLRQNICLIDENSAGEELFAWIEDSLKLGDLAKELRSVKRKYGDCLKTCSYLLERSGCVDRQGLNGFETEALALSGKTKVERMKIRSDKLLANGRCRQAASGYLRLLEEDLSIRMTGELAGNIWHNLGVCYARTFMFNEAADCFNQALKKRDSKVSRQCWLYALNFLDDLDETADDLGISYEETTAALRRINEVSSEEEYFKERKKIPSGYQRESREGLKEAFSKWTALYEDMMS